MFRKDGNLEIVLQQLAQALFIGETIVFLGVSVFIFSKAQNAYDLEELYNIIGCIFLIGGPIMSYISNLLLYSVGEIIYLMKKVINIKSEK